MKFAGTSHLNADREAVYNALNDPAVLVRSIPGCQRLEALGQDSYTMTVAAGVGSIKGVYDGKVSLSDQQAPGSYRMHAEGAGAPGTLSADVLITLEESGDGGTDLTYDADATVGGMIGGVGQRMLTGVSKRMAGEFFGNVDTVIARGPEALTAQASGAPSAGAAGGMVSGGQTGAAGSPTLATPGGGQVFTAPGAAAATGAAAGSGGPGFLVGVAVGAAVALAGAVVGGWLAGRRSPRAG
jgi:hypothetical protein